MFEPAMRCAVVLGIAATLAACANPGFVQISPDTYMLSRTDKGGIFGNPSAMKADVLREASEFAESKGKLRFLSLSAIHRWLC